MAIRAHSLLSLALQVSAATGSSFVVFTACNSGGAQNWQRTFPSLTDGQLECVAETEGNAAIEFTSAAEALVAFTTLCREATENYTSIIDGEIFLVHATGLERTFEIHSTTYPVLERGEWREELAPNRL